MIAPWAFGFAVTQAIELPVYWFALRPRPPWVRLAIGFAASAITHPLAFSLLVAPIGPYDLRLVVAEGSAWLVEAGWLHAWGVRRALWWSLVANGASYGLGAIAWMVAYPAGS